MPSQVEENKGPTRSSQVLAETDRLDGAILSLNDLVANLEVLLSRVLQEPSPSDEKKPEEVDPVLVPLASNIRDLRYRVDATSRFISQIYERLEI